MQLNTIEDIIEDIRQGRMVIIMDDEDRENEGDLVMAAARVTAEHINFMARYGRGLICLPLTRDRCQQLRLPLMVSANESKYPTNFTVSIEAASGVTTGISAADRAATVRAAVAPDAQPQDLVSPGHIFPIMAQPGGVLTRAGHTEASCDLARLAGLEPAAVIVEILNDDGSMARRPQLEVFAQQHGLKIGTIADLIRYRIAHEKTVQRVAECDLPTEFGAFRLVSYQDPVDGQLHFALVLGEVDPQQAVLTRVQVFDTLADVLGALHGSGWTLRSALARVAREGSGVVLLLRQGEDPRELIRRVRDCQLEKNGDPPASAGAELRTLGLGARILSDLGVRRMRVLSKPKKVHGLSGFGLEVVEYVD